MLFLIVNGVSRSLPLVPGETLADLLRQRLGLTGTKMGCKEAECGACTVLVNGEPILSCSYPALRAQGKQITTIEGLSSDGTHPVQRAWIAEHVTQCGYCQPGQIMSAVALLAKNPNPSDADIDATMRDVLCRCGTYQRIRAAIHRAAQEA